MTTNLEPDSTHPMCPVMLHSKEEEKNSHSCCNGNLMLAPVNYALLLGPYTSLRYFPTPPRTTHYLFNFTQLSPCPYGCHSWIASATTRR